MTIEVHQVAGQLHERLEQAHVASEGLAGSLELDLVKVVVENEHDHAQRRQRQQAANGPIHRHKFKHLLLIDNDVARHAQERQCVAGVFERHKMVQIIPEVHQRPDSRDERLTYLSHLHGGEVRQRLQCFLGLLGLLLLIESLLALDLLKVGGSTWIILVVAVLVNLD